MLSGAAVWRYCRLLWYKCTRCFYTFQIYFAISNIFIFAICLCPSRTYNIATCTKTQYGTFYGMQHCLCGIILKINLGRILTFVKQHICSTCNMSTRAQFGTFHIPHAILIICPCALAIYEVYSTLPNEFYHLTNY